MNKKQKALGIIKRNKIFQSVNLLGHRLLIKNISVHIIQSMGKCRKDHFMNTSCSGAKIYQIK